MTLFSFHADLDDPRDLIPALQRATGESDVCLLEGWNGCKRGTLEPIEDEATGTVNVEWMRRKGRFSLDVQVFGHNIAPLETTARISRTVATSLKRAVLFSDCSAFPYSYFSAEPDGSIWAQLLVIDELDDDIMDLQIYDHDDPLHLYPRMVFAADDVLPARAPGVPESWSAGEASCEAQVSGKLCTVFAARCPNQRKSGLFQTNCAPR
jgi:hypothetical protein